MDGGMLAEQKKQVIVRKYGCHAPVENEAAAIEIMFRRNRLWNSMVEAFRAQQAAAEQLRKDADVEYASLASAYAECDERIEALLKRKRSAVSKHEISAAIAAERAARKDVAGQLKAARARAKVSAKSATDAAWSEFNERVKALVRESGIWWGNSESVIESFEAARKKIKAGSQIQFHRFTGEGILRVRQSGGGIPMREFLAGEWSMAHLEPIVGAKCNENHARHMLVMRIGMARNAKGERESVDLRLPLILHRELDADSTLKYITVRRERIGMRMQWSAVITATKDARITFDAAILAGSCGINFGWKSMAEGLRVATVSDGKNEHHYYLPTDWLLRQDRYEQDYSALNDHANNYWPSILAAIPEHVDGEPGIFRAIRNAKRPSFQRIWALNETLRRDDAPYHPKLRDIVSACTNSVVDVHHAENGTARHVYRRSEGLRARQQQRREYLYRQYAHEIAAGHGYVLLDGSNYAEMAKLYDENANKNELHDTARANRVRANVSDLRLYIKHAVEKAGGVVEMVKPAYITQTCSQCSDITERASDDIHFVCKKCGAYHDIDVNAAKNLRNIGMKQESNHAVA
jgi:hypothetical protein